MGLESIEKQLRKLHDQNFITRDVFTPNASGAYIMALKTVRRTKFIPGPFKVLLSWRLQAERSVSDRAQLIKRLLRSKERFAVTDGCQNDTHR